MKRKTCTKPVIAGRQPLSSHPRKGATLRKGLGFAHRKKLQQEWRVLANTYFCINNPPDAHDRALNTRFTLRIQRRIPHSSLF